MDYARKVFDTMPHGDLFLYNTLIPSYSDVGPFQEALFTYREILRTGLLPDCYTFIYVIKSSSLLLWEGKQVHCNVIKNGFDVDVYIQSSLVTMYAQNGGALYSEKAFGDIVVRNVVTWTSMIAACVQNGFLVKGLMAFVEMLSSGTKPNVSLTNSLIGLYGKCGNMEIARALWNAMIASYEQNNTGEDAIQMPL